MPKPRPLCRECNKVLRKRFWYTDREKGEAPPVSGDEYHGRVIQTVIERPLSGYLRDHYKLWCGEYGPYGDGKFCSRGCGYRWALRHA